MNFLHAAREEISKWLMRTQNAGRLLNIPLRATTASSVLTLALQETFLAQYTVLVLVTFTAGMIFFIWAYDRFQVMNIQNRWNADRSDNYIGPTTAMNQLINARQFGVLSQSLNNNWSQEKTDEELERVTRETISQFRNGMDLGDLDER